jgi:hypothetical protein
MQRQSIHPHQPPDRGVGLSGSHREFLPSQAWPQGQLPSIYWEGMTRIELASSVWKTEALPLSYIPAGGPRSPLRGTLYPIERERQFSGSDLRELPLAVRLLCEAGRQGVLIGPRESTVRHVYVVGPVRAIPPAHLFGHPWIRIPASCRQAWFFIRHFGSPLFDMVGRSRIFRLAAMRDAPQRVERNRLDLRRSIFAGVPNPR